MMNKLLLLSLAATVLSACTTVPPTPTTEPYAGCPYIECNPDHEGLRYRNQECIQTRDLFGTVYWAWDWRGDRPDHRYNAKGDCDWEGYGGAF